MPANDTTLTVPITDPVPLSRDVIKEIALDIGKEVASHIEVMYPKAVEATSKTMLLSVRNCVFNEIMASLGEVDEDAIRRRLEERRHFRRRHRATYRKIRDQPIEGDVLNDE